MPGSGDMSDLRCRTVRRIHHVVGRQEGEQLAGDLQGVGVVLGDEVDVAAHRGVGRRRCRPRPSCVLWPVAALMTSGPQMNMLAFFCVMMMKSVRAGE